MSSSEERKLYWQGDQLLDQQLHPVGTRLLLSHKSDPGNSNPYEVTIIEWAPSGKLVKLQGLQGSPYWTSCWNYYPVVVEVLPNETPVIQ